LCFPGWSWGLAGGLVVEDELAQQFAGDGVDDADAQVLDEEQDVGSGLIDHFRGSPSLRERLRMAFREFGTKMSRLKSRHQEPRSVDHPVLVWVVAPVKVSATIGPVTALVGGHR
jgi:hypothetical protein